MRLVLASERVSEFVAKWGTMKEEIFFGSIALVFTSLLLLLRGLFLSGLRRGSGGYYELRLEDDRGDSRQDDYTNNRSAKQSLAPTKSLMAPASSDEWPSEIIVPAEHFSRK